MKLRRVRRRLRLRNERLKLRQSLIEAISRPSRHHFPIEHETGFGLGFGRWRFQTEGYRYLIEINAFKKLPHSRSVIQATLLKQCPNQFKLLSMRLPAACGFLLDELQKNIVVPDT